MDEEEDKEENEEAVDQEEKANTRINTKIQQSTASVASWEETKVNDTKD